MLKVRDEDATEATSEVIQFLRKLKELDREIQTEKMVHYPSISLYQALKYKIFFKNLLLHPVILEKRDYYSVKRGELSTEEMLEKLAKVLEYEFSKEEHLTVEERTKIIKLHAKIKNSLEKTNDI